MNALDMTGIKKIYNNMPVLDIDTFSVQSGEKVAIVGPNGSGKSTLLNIAALLSVPNSGIFRVFDQVVDFRHPEVHRSKVTLVSQEPFFFAGSLIRNMAFGLTSGGKNSGNQKKEIAEYMEMLGVSHLADRSPRTFSSGEKMRAAISRALALKTPILLLDEPFANIDSQSVRMLENIIRNFSTEKTVIFSTHELSRAYELADRIITLQSGKLSPWTPENLYSLKASKIEDGSELATLSGLKIYYPGELDEGRHYIVSINPSQVIISRDLIQSSAQNSFTGNIKRIETIGNNLVVFTVECSEDFTIKATVTTRTVKSFNMTVSDEIWVHFKAAAIHVFD